MRLKTLDPISGLVVGFLIAAVLWLGIALAIMCIVIYRSI
jgi:hypothetical protein